MLSRRWTRWAAPAFAAAATLSLVVGTIAPVAAQSAPPALPAVTAQPALTPLSADEEAGLLFMLEEEKLAHDLYIALDEAARAGGWALPIFANIARAETVHSNAVLRQLTAYGVAVPAAELPAGTFLNADLQALYDTLLAQGRASLADALTVGALVEETDIADLDARMAGTEHAAMSRVYTQLRRGSTHHLQAFVGLLDAQAGATYTSQVLSAADFSAALSAARPERNDK